MITYLDDICYFGNNFEEALQRLEQIFIRLEEIYSPNFPFLTMYKIICFFFAPINMLSGKLRIDFIYIFKYKIFITFCFTKIFKN